MAIYLILIFIGLLEAAGFVVAMYMFIYKRKSAMRKALTGLQQELAEKEQLRSKIVEVYGRMVEVTKVADSLKELTSLQDSLKAERGRITITQTELETVETRLCELEEIERELEASSTETQEELTILQKKGEELKGKNDQLKKQIAMSTKELDDALGQIEMSAQALEKIDSMKSDLIGTENQIETMLVQLEEMNQQYVLLKVRYDALDIEYAQLYEKFSSAEAAMSAKEQG